MKDIPVVGDLRQIGFMVGIELVKDRKTKERFPITERMGHKVILKAREHGVIIRPLGDIIVLVPHLSFTNEELQILVEVTCNAIRETSSHG